MQVQLRFPTTASEIENAIQYWLDLLVNEDYEEAFKITAHDLYYEWTPKLMQEVINGYGFPEACNETETKLFCKPSLDFF